VDRGRRERSAAAGCEACAALHHHERCRLSSVPDPNPARARAAVGSSNNTFGIKGVEDHCFFFRSITNASELRRRVSECFERAALPQATPEARGRAACCSQHGGGAQPCLTTPLVDQCKRGQRQSATCLSCHMKCGSSRHSRHGTRKRLAPVHDPGCDLMGPRPFHSALPGICSPGWCSKRYSLRRASSRPR